MDCHQYMEEPMVLKGIEQCLWPADETDNEALELRLYADRIAEKLHYQNTQPVYTLDRGMTFIDSDSEHDTDMEPGISEDGFSSSSSVVETPDRESSCENIDSSTSPDGVISQTLVPAQLSQEWSLPPADYAEDPAVGTYNPLNAVSVSQLPQVESSYVFHAGARHAPDRYGNYYQSANPQFSYDESGSGYAAPIGYQTFPPNNAPTSAAGGLVGNMNIAIYNPSLVNGNNAWHFSEYGRPDGLPHDQGTLDAQYPGTEAVSVEPSAHSSPSDNDSSPYCTSMTPPSDGSRWSSSPQCQQVVPVASTAIQLTELTSQFAITPSTFCQAQNLSDGQHVQFYPNRHFQQLLPANQYNLSGQSQGPVNISRTSTDQINNLRGFAGTKRKLSVRGVQSQVPKDFVFHNHNSSNGPPYDSLRRPVTRGGAPGRPKKSGPADPESTTQMRHDGQCWRCMYDRKKCNGPGECDPCRFRNDSLPLNQRLPCDRTKFKDLIAFTFPALLSTIHSKKARQDLVGAHVFGWKERKSIQIHLNIAEGLPHFSCSVQEFKTRTPEAAQRTQYVTLAKDLKCERQTVPSPPLGIYNLSDRQDKKYEGDVDDIVNNYFSTFSQRCFDRKPNPFLSKLLRAMGKFSSKCESSSEEGKRYRSVLKVLVINYILSHKLYLSHDTVGTTLAQMEAKDIPCPTSFDLSEALSPIVASYQLKSIFSRILQKLQATAQQNVQAAIRSSNRKVHWSEAFFCLLGLAMSFECIQRSIHLFLDNEVRNTEMGKCNNPISRKDADRKAETACDAIDHHFKVMTGRFAQKYNINDGGRGSNNAAAAASNSRRQDPFNPLVNANQREELGEKRKRFVEEVVGLLREHQASVFGPETKLPVGSGVKAEFEARLVGRFLGMFFN
jgi:hypothetical protein